MFTIFGLYAYFCVKFNESLHLIFYVIYINLKYVKYIFFRLLVAFTLRNMEKIWNMVCVPT